MHAICHSDGARVLSNSFEMIDGLAGGGLATRQSHDSIAKYQQRPDECTSRLGVHCLS
jgi:hypothetical protein